MSDQPWKQIVNFCHSHVKTFAYTGEIIINQCACMTNCFAIQIVANVITTNTCQRNNYTEVTSAHGRLFKTTIPHPQLSTHSGLCPSPWGPSQPPQPPLPSSSCDDSSLPWAHRQKRGTAPTSPLLSNAKAAHGISAHRLVSHIGPNKEMKETLVPVHYQSSQCSHCRSSLAFSLTDTLPPSLPPSRSPLTSSIIWSMSPWHLR